MEEQLNSCLPIESPIVDIIDTLRTRFKDTVLQDAAPLIMAAQNAPILFVPKSLLESQWGIFIAMQHPDHFIYGIDVERTEQKRPFRKPDVTETGEVYTFNKPYPAPYGIYTGAERGSLTEVSASGLNNRLLEVYNWIKTQVNSTGEIPNWASQLGFGAKGLKAIDNTIRNSGMLCSVPDPVVSGGDPRYEDIYWGSEKTRSPKMPIRSFIMLCAMVLAENTNSHKAFLSDSHPYRDLKASLQKRDESYDRRTQTVMRILNDDTNEFTIGQVAHLMKIIDALSLEFKIGGNRYNRKWIYNSGHDREARFSTRPGSKQQLIILTPQEMASIVRETLLKAKCLQARLSENGKYTIFKPSTNISFEDPELYAEKCKTCPLQKLCPQAFEHATTIHNKVLERDKQITEASLDRSAIGLMRIIREQNNAYALKQRQNRNLPPIYHFVRYDPVTAELKVFALQAPY